MYEETLETDDNTELSKDESGEENAAVARKGKMQEETITKQKHKSMNMERK